MYEGANGILTGQEETSGRERKALCGEEVQAMLCGKEAGPVFVEEYGQGMGPS